MNRRHFLVATLAGMPLSIGALGRVLAADELVFLVVGDWGTGGALQRRIAASMAGVAARSGALFVVSTGDNIYPDGVTSDVDPQWKTKFEKIYAELPLLWWSVLGNHDHRGNPDAQIAYGKRNPRWNMTGRTWRKNVTVAGSGMLSILGIDTTPIMQGAEGWKNQLAWLDETLTSTPAAVSVVVGHHPLRSYGHYGDSQQLVKHVKPVLDRHRVRLYMCGHDHDMQLISNPSDSFSCLVSGGGGGERSTSLGPHSKIAYTDGGFACVRMRSSELSTELFDSHGVSKGSFDL